MAKDTRRKILDEAEKEFLAHGFKNASLRNIVKTAGFTLGAFYGYFKTKEELFDALVKEHYDLFIGNFKKAQRDFALLPPEEQPRNVGHSSTGFIGWAVEYMYAHFAVFKLLLCCSDGTRYSSLIHDMVEIEMKGTYAFIRVLKKSGRAVPEIDRQLAHMLVSGMFSAFFEIIVHDMKKEKAVVYMRTLREFYSAGWLKIMGLL